ANDAADLCCGLRPVAAEAEAVTGRSADAQHAVVEPRVLGHRAADVRAQIARIQAAIVEPHGAEVQIVPHARAGRVAAVELDIIGAGRGDAVDELVART